jgi:hypothetical protein
VLYLVKVVDLAEQVEISAKSPVFLPRSLREKREYAVFNHVCQAYRESVAFIRSSRLDCEVNRAPGISHTRADQIRRNRGGIPLNRQRIALPSYGECSCRIKPNCKHSEIFSEKPFAAGLRAETTPISQALLDILID